MDTVELQDTIFDDVISRGDDSGNTYDRFTVCTGINNQVMIDGIRIEFLTVHNCIGPELQAVFALIKVRYRDVFSAGGGYIYDFILYLDIFQLDAVYIPFHYFCSVPADPVMDGGSRCRILH